MVRQKRPATKLRQSLGDIRSFFASDNALPTPDTQSDYDDDTINVMELSRAAKQTNNKRRRVLSHVESELDVSGLLQDEQANSCSRRTQEAINYTALCSSVACNKY